MKAPETCRVTECNLCGPNGERIVLREGDRIELDNVAGIVCGKPSTGTVIGMTTYPCGDLIAVAIELDPNEKLCEVHKRLKAEAAKWPPLPWASLGRPIQDMPKSGLDGSGGPVYLTADGVHFAASTGALRILTKPAGESAPVPT